MSYELENLLLETNTAGWVVGESVVGDTITDAAGLWEDQKAIFNSVNVSRSVNIDQMILSRPQATVVSLSTSELENGEGLWGKKARVRFVKEEVPPTRTNLVANPSLVDLSGWRASAANDTMTTVEDEGIPAGQIIQGSAGSTVYTDPDPNFNVVAGDIVRFSVEVKPLSQAIGDVMALRLYSYDGASYTNGSTVFGGWPITAGVYSRVSVTGIVATAGTVRTLIWPGGGALGDGFRWRRAIVEIGQSLPEDDSYFVGTLGDSPAVDKIIGQGIIRDVATDISISDRGKTVTDIGIEAVGVIQEASETTLANFYAPSETVEARILRAWPEAIVTNCPTVMAVRPTTNVSALTVMQDAADVELARFYVDAEDKFIVNGNACAGPFITLSDLAEPSYSSLTLGETDEFAVRTIVVEAKQNEEVVTSRTADQGNVHNTEKYTIDVPPDQSDIESWATAFPVKSYTENTVRSVSLPWHEDLAGVELLSRINIVYGGNVFDCGVVGISHSITPFSWMVELELIPGALLMPQPTPATPSPIRKLFVSNQLEKRLIISWEGPAVADSITGYEVRFRQGEEAPVTRTDGTAVTEILPAWARGLSHTNLPERTTYSYSVWALTDDPTVFSRRVSRSGTVRNDILPGAVRNLSASGQGQNGYDLTWNPPLNSSNLDYYVVEQWNDNNPTRVRINTEGTYRFITTVNNIRNFVAVYPIATNGYKGPVTTITIDRR